MTLTMTAKELEEINAGAALAGLDRSSFMRSAAIAQGRQLMLTKRPKLPRK